MKLIGNILKETTKHSFNKRNNIVTSREIKLLEQRQVLEELVSTAKRTAFGTRYYFDKLEKNPLRQELYKSYVPLSNYESFHQDWLSRSLDGEENVIWPGKIQFYALSSGTTTASSKRIPVSEHMIRQFQKISFEQIIGLHSLNLPSSFYDSKVLIIGGSTSLNRKEHHYEGDLSGILAKNKSLAYSPFTKPKKKISRLNDWNEKLDAITEKAPKWDIGAIAGVPSWVSILLENIINEYKLESIHDIWPNFRVYSHGGVFLDPYREKLESFFGKEVIYQNTFLASEGYFGYQKNPDLNGMHLITNKGVYFEFIEEKDFHKCNSGELHDINTVDLAHIKAHVNYGLVISTSSGLWRYILGDIVRFTDINEFKFNIMGRVNSSINLVGEHLSEGNMMQAVKQTAEGLGVSVEEFCVFPSKSKDRHNWYIGSNQKIDCNRFSALLNANLTLLNDDYKFVRSHILKSPRVKSLPLQKFYEYLELNNKMGGQHKFPKVMTKEQAIQWELFLTRLDI